MKRPRVFGLVLKLINMVGLELGMPLTCRKEAMNQETDQSLRHLDNNDRRVRNLKLD